MSLSHTRSLEEIEAWVLNNYHLLDFNYYSSQAETSLSVLTFLERYDILSLLQSRGCQNAFYLRGSYLRQGKLDQEKYLTVHCSMSTLNSLYLDLAKQDKITIVKLSDECCAIVTNPDLYSYREPNYIFLSATTFGSPLPCPSQFIELNLRYHFLAQEVLVTLIAKLAELKIQEAHNPIVSELLKGFSVSQDSKYHSHSVTNHLLASAIQMQELIAEEYSVCIPAEERRPLVLGALLHDIGKSSTAKPRSETS